MTSHPWLKIGEVCEVSSEDRKKLCPYLEIRQGARKTSYRVNFRRKGVVLREVLEGDFKDWKSANRVAIAKVTEALYQAKDLPEDLTRCEDLCRELIQLKASKAEATYEQTEIFFRKHIIPFLNEFCPYAKDLNATVWLKYKNHIRLKNPSVTLFNHWKFFTMLFKYADEKGLIKVRPKLEYSEEKEDFRKPGMLISDEHFKAMISVASNTWRDRTILGRITGQRPGLIRRLRKDQVGLETGLVRVEKGDSKNRRQYAFYLPKQALDLLKDRALFKHVQDSPYFFPMETDKGRPMDKHLGGWKAMLERAEINLEYTPHDLRHTFLTEKFKTAKNPALICYQCDLSLEEAMRTYIHFEATDTLPVAQESEKRAQELLGGVHAL